MIEAQRKAIKKYKQSKRGSIINKKCNRKASMKYYYKNREKILCGHKKYRKTNKGRQVLRRAISKSDAKRRRKLNWIPMFENPFDESIKVDYHHINDAYVVAIPKELHEIYLGKYHKEKVMEIVKQIYL